MNKWKNLKVLVSKEDSSVNFIHPKGFESRFVQRSPDYFICYLSSHTGCNKACRFCHLTQTGQTDFEPATLDDYLDQVTPVFEHFANDRESLDKLEKIHFNLMARGEPLSNPVVVNNLYYLVLYLTSKAWSCFKVDSKIKISTIFPTDFNLDQLECMLSYPSSWDKINNRFEAYPAGYSKEVIESTDLYYSLYSLNPEFRKRWLPKAHDPYVVIPRLVKVQQESGLKVVLHWAFIKGENDNLDEVHKLGEFIQKSGLRCKFNLVRYNPFSSEQGEESDLLLENFDALTSYLSEPNSRVIPRVGFDVKASCGMFVDTSGYRIGNVTIKPGVRDYGDGCDVIEEKYRLIMEQKMIDEDKGENHV